MEKPVSIKANEAGEIVFEPTSVHGFVVEPFDKYDGFACLAVMEGNSAVMFGKITDVVYKD